MTEHNNPPAFPTVDYKQPAGLGAHVMTITNGMTLLDHFAGLAMQGLIANPEFDMRAPFPDVASTVYKMADAMLKERQSWIK